RRAQHELASADLLGGYMLQLRAVRHDQRTGFKLVILESRNLQPSVDHADVPALYILNHDVQAIQARAQRNRLLINGLQLDRLLEQTVWKIAADWIFEGLHHAAS